MQPNTNNEMTPLLGEGKHHHQLSTTWKILLILVVILLLASIILCYFLFDHLRGVQNNNTSLNNTVTALNGELGNDKTKLSDLQAEVTKLQNGITTPTASTSSQSDIILKITSAQYVNPSGTVTQSGSWLGIRVTLTNPTSTPVYVGSESVTLKDGNGNTYQQTGFVNATTLPDGWGANTFQDQTIPAHGSVPCNFIFLLPNKNMSGFTLLFNTNSYPVIVSA
jgi:cell division protein FtsL